MNQRGDMTARTVSPSQIADRMISAQALKSKHCLPPQLACRPGLRKRQSQRAGTHRYRRLGSEPSESGIAPVSWLYWSCLRLHQCTHHM
jgi:hypothetical protein